MIVSLLVALLNTALNGTWFLLQSLLGNVFQNFNSAMAAVINNPGLKIAAGIIDLTMGWDFFKLFITLVFLVLPIIKLAKYLIGIFTKGS